MIALGTNFDEYVDKLVDAMHSIADIDEDMNGDEFIEQYIKQLAGSRIIIHFTTRCGKEFMSFVPYSSVYIRGDNKKYSYIVPYPGIFKVKIILNHSSDILTPPFVARWKLTGSYDPEPEKQYRYTRYVFGEITDIVNDADWLVDAMFTPERMYFDSYRKEFKVGEAIVHNIYPNMWTGYMFVKGHRYKAFGYGNEKKAYIGKIVSVQLFGYSMFPVVLPYRNATEEDLLTYMTKSES